jgi:alpha-tubulin suppressor-like RCC1 family protein
MASGFYDNRSGVNIDPIQEVLDSCVSYSYLDANFPNISNTLGLRKKVLIGGDNTHGQLGLSDRVNRNTIVELAEGSINRAIVQSGGATMLLDTEGDIRACGRGYRGQLGINDPYGYNKSSFSKINSIVKFKAIYPSFNTVYAIAPDNTLFYCGDNEYGQCGYGSQNTHKSTYTSNPNISNVKMVSGGLTSTAIVKNDGTIWGAGQNSQGQLGISNTTSNTSFQSAIGMTNVSMVSCGRYYTVAVKTDGTVWAVGDNPKGQLGLSDVVQRSTYQSVPIINNVKSVACGYAHTLVLKTDGTVWTVGSNGNGQLGLSDLTNRSTFTSVPGLSNVKSIAAGIGHSYALFSNGDVYVVGSNDSNQLADGSFNGNAWSPMSVPLVNNIKLIDYNAIDGSEYNTSLAGTRMNHAMFVVDVNGGVWSTGESTQGANANSINTWDFVSVPSISNVKSISGGYQHSIALKTDGTVWTVGSNTQGHLGLSDLVSRSTFQSVPIINNVKSIACGSYFTIALKTDGTVLGVGQNVNTGQLGLSDTVNRSTFTSIPGINDVKSIACGQNHSIALKTDGTVWTVGQNHNGQLGLSDIVYRSTFTSVPGLSNVKAITAGQYHSIALKTDGTVWTVGQNVYGQLGLSNVVYRSTFTSVPGLSNVKSISGGGGHSIALKADGTVWTVGDNSYGQLGLSDLTNRSTFTSVTAITNANSIAGAINNTFMATNTGGLYACGYKGNLTYYNPMGLGKPIKSRFTKHPYLSNIKELGNLASDSTSCVFISAPTGSDEFIKNWF